jgi:threonine/homoserine/homoserine lactone efflux protein
MTELLLQFIPLFVAAIAPGIMLIVILLLGTENGLRKVLAFTLGKYLVYIGWGIFFLFLSGKISEAGGLEKPMAISAVKLFLGVLLLVLAVRSLLGEDDPDAPPPKWMAMIDKVSARELFGIGALLSVIQIRFVLLMAAGAILIVDAGLAMGQNIIALLILAFCMIWVLVIPIIVYLVMGDRAAKMLDSMNDWLARNQRWVNFVVLLLFGIVLLSSGLTELRIISR